MIEAILSPVNSEHGISKAWHVICWHFIQWKIENKRACANRNWCQEPLGTCSYLRRQMRKNSNPKSDLKYLEPMPFAQDRKLMPVKAKQAKNQNGCQDSSKVTGVYHTRKSHPVNQLLCNIPRKLHFWRTCYIHLELLMPSGNTYDQKFLSTYGCKSILLSIAP